MSSSASTSPGSGNAMPGGGSPPSPKLEWVSIVLIVLALVLYVFGAVYAIAPGTSVESIQSIALAIGLHTPAPPSDSSPQFYGWVGFTFSYMMAAGTCSLLAARPSRERFAYLNILLVLKGTSSLGGLVLFIRGPEYAFYLSTFLVDGLLFLLAWYLRAYLLQHRDPTTEEPGPRAASSPVE